MEILDYYDNDEDVKISNELSFEENFDLNPNASFFSLHDAYFNNIKYTDFQDVWTSSGIIENFEIKDVPLILAKMYKKLGNKHMYKRFIKEFNKQ